uniref:SPT6 homolog, histone chaperone and transcription elongation factor n=1 Tax=Takifugu rubripes TaxID=31033 RepID=A0A674NP27_TAKRU
VPQKKKYERVKTMDDDEEDDDEKDLIADEIFHGHGDGDLEEGEAVDEPLPRGDDDEEGEDEESGKIKDLGEAEKEKSQLCTVALQEAQEIFGGDFDFADFEADMYEQGEEEEEDQDEESWDRPKKQTKRRLGRKSIFELYEPSELESSHMTDQDNEIRTTDMPERFQLRSIPVKPAEDDELEEEAEWIFRHGFSTLTISMQESTDYLDRGTTTNFSRKGPSTIAKIKEALNFMRNQLFEVPFIAFYRKEYVEPELNINDLWKVWQWDEKWTQLKTRKQNLTRLFQKMQSYQFEQISADPDKPLADGIRPLDTADMERLKDVQTLEELGDVYNHFLLYYGRDIPKMQNAAKANKKRLKKIKEVSEDEEEEQKGPDLKLASRRDMYSICQSVGLDGLAKKFGLTPEQFGENLRDSYQRHETEQFPAEPVELAKDYVCSQFSTPEAVLEGTRYMVAMQIAREPLVRHVLRQTFQERAKINTKPTKKGKKEVDEAHFAYSFKYLKNKPVKELNGEQFLKMCLAEDEGLLAIDICIDLIGVKGYAGDQTYFDEIKQFYYRDEFSHQVQEWNRQRTLAIERSLTQFLYPQMAKELKSKLIAEAKESISCCRRLYNWLKVAPYRPDHLAEEDDDLMEENQGKGIRVLGVAYAPSSDAQMIMEDMKRAIGELEQESALPTVGVELIDNELATLYMNSKKSEADFRDYPPLLRQAVSVARKIQDPLMEYAQVCSTDEDILCLKLHPLQEHVVKEDLLSALYCEFINRVNEVGVDVNKAIAHPHTQSLVQYVCGLGPRKGSHLLKILKQNNNRLENRTQLVTMCHMGPKVFINCAGFIKIDTASLGDSIYYFIIILFTQIFLTARTHILRSWTALASIPRHRLVSLGTNSSHQGYGNKGITLYDIRAELSCRYKDLRVPYRVPNTEEVFNMVTKETPETFYIGKLITSIVTGIAHRRPQGESYDQAIRNDATGLWQCPFCQQDNFPELSEVWNHFDSGSCPGQAIGVRSRLDNGVQGFIPTKFLSDKVVKHPEERVKVGMTVHCRIMKIDIEKFSVDLTCRTSDLMDKANEWKLPKDSYYDFDTESEDQKLDEELKKKQQRTPYIKRVIAHPNFHNISFNQAEKMMETLDQGDLIIRPSSKGENHLTVTWKVADGIYQHVDVKEEGKENAFSLGHTLWINTEEFEDLDEITARYIQPMASFARDLLGHKYFQECSGGSKEKMEELLVRTKREKPTFIPYFVSACKDLPGKFLLGYQPRGKPRVEYVTITPDGFRYRSQIFPTVNGLFRWFKDHYHEPVPGITPSNSSRTRTPASLNATPANINIADLTRAVNALPRNMTSQMFNAIAAVTGQGQNPNTTPAQWGSSQYGYSGSTGGGGSSSAYHVFATPQQPMATPMMTPSYSYTTPSQQALGTPQYPGATPQSSHSHSHAHGSHRLLSPSHRPSGSNSSAVDWGKMAEQWLKEKEAEGRKKTPRMTPRPSPSPMIESTPMSIAGDATPLLDEMDR